MGLPSRGSVLKLRTLIVQVIKFAIAGLIAAATFEPLSASERLGALIGPSVVPNGLGVNVHFDEGHGRDLDKIAELGFRLIRSDLLWDKVEITRGHYDFSRYDRLVQDSRLRGITPLLILDYSNPLYAEPSSKPARPEARAAPPIEDSAQSAFVTFARMAAARYGDRVIWEIWNEPDLNFGKPFNLDAYVSLAIRVCDSIRAVSSTVPIIAPASNGFRFELYKRLLLADTKRCLDGLSVHPYRNEAPETVITDWARMTDMMRKLAIGDQSIVPLNSESGYSSYGAPWTRERQADFDLRQYLLDLLAEVPVTIIYDYQDDSPERGDQESNYGLITFDGQAKPVASAFSNLLRELTGLRLLGRVLTPPHDFVLAFGSDEGSLKLVGWTQIERGHQLTLGPEICLLSSPTSTSCSAGRVYQVEKTETALTSRPQVVRANAVLQPDAYDKAR